MIWFVPRRADEVLLLKKRLENVGAFVEIEESSVQSYAGKPNVIYYTRPDCLESALLTRKLLSDAKIDAVTKVPWPDRDQEKPSCLVMLIA